MTRDLDSRFNNREKAAVEEWLQMPEKAFHFMRDHPQHGTAILGGTWGCKMTQEVHQIFLYYFLPLLPS